MTADERTHRLEQRVDRLEDQYRDDVSAIHGKLDSLVQSVNSVLVRTAKTECPAPGSCMSLSADLKATIVAHTSTMLRVERLELRILDLERWQWRMIGALGVLMVALTLFAPSIRKIIGLE